MEKQWMGLEPKEQGSPSKRCKKMRSLVRCRIRANYPLSALVSTPGMVGLPHTDRARAVPEIATGPTTKNLRCRGMRRTLVPMSRATSWNSWSRTGSRESGETVNGPQVEAVEGGVPYGPEGGG